MDKYSNFWKIENPRERGDKELSGAAARTGS